jgi:hypothetical protein
MGPTVWELEGPIPIENKLNTLIAINELQINENYFIPSIAV